MKEGTYNPEWISCDLMCSFCGEVENCPLEKEFLNGFKTPKNRKRGKRK